jgi:hypothetical protein
MWNLYHTNELCDHITEETNNWLKTHNITSARGKKRAKSSIIEISKQDVLNWYTLEIAFGLVNFKRTNWAWKRTSTIDHLFGNDFFINTMSYDMYKLIRRALQAKLPFLMNYYNKVIFAIFMC